ncbi:Glycosyltransferase family 25 (LPS biosynthesis protein) [Nitrosospira sp. Nsp13]|nr:Glycosyltransferase family 25 (LPS biosynthesis protein) [Nitrosospira sp. Nsp13]
MLAISWRTTKLLRILSVRAQNIRTKFSRMSATVKYFQEQPEALRGYILYARELGIIETFRHAIEFIIRGGPRQAPMSTAVRRKLLLRSSSGQSTVILTTPHCLYVAQAISIALSRVGIKSQIIHERPIQGFSDDTHFVICPHMFIQLPRFYITLQMEQSVSSRWFTDEYLRMLENSLAVLDYSTVNINFLKLKGLSLRQLYYLPIDHVADYEPELNPTEENYDVIFYGDANNERRQKFLHELERHCRIKIINNLFGVALHTALANARVVVNIHYYAGALLETTRIWECLSLHKLVISERSSDMDQHSNLTKLIDFVDVDDVSSMVERVRYWLDNDSLRQQRISENRLLLQEQFNRFDYFFYRFLLATDNITFEDFWSQIGHKSKLPSDQICLTLPEYAERTAEFNKDNYFGFSCFPGLRHTQSWLGCAMSYKLMIMLARQQRLPQVTICEDDVEFPPDFAARWQDIRNYLNEENIDWDIFSGLMADLNKNVRILETHIYQGHHFATIDKLISTVFNVYNQRVFDTIAQWDETNHDVTTNTIDRYLENYGAIKVLTTTPFLVGHKESQESTLWGIQNHEYTDLILASSRLLKEKMQAHNKDARSGNGAT